MKYYFENANALIDGIELLSEDLGIEIADDGDADIKVVLVEACDKVSELILSGSEAKITYGGGKARFFRALSKLVAWVNEGVAEKCEREVTLFKTNGAMVDMSRNAVMNTKTVKVMLRAMARMGLNTFMLYTEDTYEVEGYPHFGHLRGRYTKDELKELDAYALKLGIELIPCVQMLGHLATHLRWAASASYKDATTTMLVGADATYKLIDSMLKTISECFTSRRLHMGMDETHDLGTGAYLKKYGFRESREIYFEHLEKIADMARSYGFEPMMWSDMFFHLAGKNLTGYRDYDPRVEFTDEILSLVPKGIRQVFWDYYNEDEEFYTVNIDKHQKFFDKDSMFAGGIWTWSGHCPLYSRSLCFTIPALEACRKKGVKEIFATIWHNGSEGSLILSLAGLAWYADYDYRGKFDIGGVRECFKIATGESYSDLMKCELPEHPDGGMISLTRAFLYNDPLLGKVDKHIEGLDTRSYYLTVTDKLLSSHGDKGIFTSAYEVIYRLSSLLENKADFGLRLKAAYDAKDEEQLKALYAECDVIIKKIGYLRAAHRTAWMQYNKPFGWEVHDTRYGGLVARFDTVKERILDFINGDIERIEELEAPRLLIDGREYDGSYSKFDLKYRFLWNSYSGYTLIGIL